MKIDLSHRQIKLLQDALGHTDYDYSEFGQEEADEMWSKLTVALSTERVFKKTEEFRPDQEVSVKSLDGKKIVNTGRVVKIQSDKNVEVKVDQEISGGQSTIVVDPSLVVKGYQKIGPVSESLNEDAQILDKVRYGKDRGYVTGEIDGKMIVMVQGSTFLVDPKDLKEWNRKPDLTTEPHMKFDEETQKLLFEQYVKCGVFHGNVPIKMNGCYVRYSQWEKAAPEQQIRVLVEGNTTFMPKSQVRILEDLNDFANVDSYVPGVLVDEATEDAIENVLVHAVDYTAAIGDADSVRVVKRGLSGEQEIQTVPKAMVRTLAV